MSFGFKLIRPIIASVAAIFLFLIIGYLLDSRIVYYIGIPVSILGIFVHQIIVYTSPMDEKAEQEAKKMVLGRPKKVVDEQNEVRGTLPPLMPERTKVPEYSPKEERILRKEDESMSKIMHYREEMAKLDVILTDLDKEKFLLEEKYNGIERQQVALREQRKAFKEKILEVI